MDPRTSDWAPPAQMGALRTRAFVVGGVFTLASLAGLLMDREQFFRSYITAFVYVLALPIGALGLMMINHVTRGAWGVVSRRVLEASSRTLPVLVVFFLPLIAGMHEVFKWSDPAVVAEDGLIAGKVLYLNQPFFFVRAAFYFAVWIALAYGLSNLSRRQDHDPDASFARQMQGISAGGIVIFMITLTFASFDWIMSLDPHWFSSIYGVYYAGGAALAALAFTVLVALWLGKHEPMSEVYRPSHFHDWGKLMLAFTMLWAYFSVSQLIIIWSGNLPEEVPWYMVRTSGMYKYFAQAIMVLHFFVPFALLLSTDIKRDRRRLALVAVWLLVMRWIDLYWQTAPSFNIYDPSKASLHWLDATLVLGLGGLWVGFFFAQLASRPLIPRNEPFLREALAHHG